MKPVLAILPVLPGKLDAWKSMMTMADDPGLKELAKQAGVERVRFWHFKTPDGGDMAAVLHEGPSPEKWMPTMMESNHPLAQKFRAMAAEVHGFTPEAAKNAPPLPEFLKDVSLN
jgi:hypothetical protein